MTENFIEKPEGKPVKAFRARVKMYGNDVVVVSSEPRIIEGEQPQDDQAEGQELVLQE